eukprot:CAMPEP_0206421778 /NCGR_PEP_ID=MMETSP0324_2-20121206/1657_1 /ASSEMBLY_ACC=CAM_ASM_000836 /TAXON_ID=2866 /ORGANISM="Crypthecodinium cohnii, Strain Seligo" /LENGTH=66 /DNA_ID=CAMNT_0053885951 /DNA_START=135 /DNA_END=332 /DNA_ORIENTATION=+
MTCRHMQLLQREGFHHAISLGTSNVTILWPVAFDRNTGKLADSAWPDGKPNGGAYAAAMLKELPAT